MLLKLKNLLLVVTLLLFSTLLFAQTPPPMGSAAAYVLFTTGGAITNTGVSQITGDFGTNGGAITGFGNVNGQMHIADATSAQCALDVGIAYNNLAAQTPAISLAATLGNGQVLSPNIYMVVSAATITGTLTLDGCGDPNACFVFQINGVLSTVTGADVILTNGTKACNVFWSVAGALNMATNISSKGTIIASGAVTLGAGCSVEGRIFTTAGAFVVSSLNASIPIGCSPIFTGPAAPNMGTVECFAVLTSNGIVTNTDSTYVVGDIGTNNLTASGFNPTGVVGLIHPIPDTATAVASADLLTLHNYLNSLPINIELLYPVLSGHSQVLTPNVYVMNAAATITDTLFLDARGVTDAVFVIRILGALTTNSNPQIVLVGGARARNVFWQVEGSATVNGGNFNGIIIANNGAVVLNSGVIHTGRALSINGNITTQNVNITATNTVGVASSSPTLCTNTLLTTITHTTKGATGIGAAIGLPTGVTADWADNTITLNGIPTSVGTFNYSIPLTGGCGSVNATGTITVSSVGSANTANTSSSTPTICSNTVLTNITHTTTGATGIGAAMGLPPGVTATWLSNTIIISGRPTATGTFNYIIPLSGGCGRVNAFGTITVTPITENTVIAFSSAPLCINTAFSYISHTTTGASGIGPAWGLPPGVTATWSSDSITISGTPTSSGTFNYSMRLTGGCGCVNTTGTVIISADNGPTANLITPSETSCHGVKVTLNGNVTAIGAWTLTLSNGQTTTGTGNGVWNSIVEPTSTTTYTITSIIDASTCLAVPSGSTTLTLAPTGTALGNNNESASCAVSQAGWVNYYHSSGRMIASINSAGQDLGVVTVTSYENGTVPSIPDCINPSPTHITAVMQRHWVITPSIQPTLPVIVRLPFTDLEFTNLSGVANANINSNDDVNIITDIKLSKYSGPLNVDSSATNNCISAGGSEGTTIHTQVAIGSTTEYSAVTGAQYIDFSISEFSEFWLHGSLINYALPIELLSFTAVPKGTHVQLNWVTSSETNSNYFTVERSKDGINFETIEIVDGAGNSSQILNYSAVDDGPLNGVSYYRLKQTDDNGEFDYSTTVTVEFNNINNFIFNIYPNPNDGDGFNLQISKNTTTELLVAVYDVLGKEIYSKLIVPSIDGSGGYAINPSQKLNPGVYLVIATSGNRVYNKRLIVK